MEETEQCTFYDVGCWQRHLLDGLEDMVLWLLEMLLNAAAFALEAIPVPDWVSSVDSVTLPSSVVFFTSLFQLPFGLTVVASAYTLRFLIRRIPLIG